MKNSGERSEKRGICGICSAGCWIVATYDDKGRMVNVRADEGSPMGIICKIGEYSPDIIYSKERLLFPLRRKGEKGNYDFERISWDDAFGIIVDRLQAIKEQYGPEAAAIYTGVGSFEQSICDVYQPRGVAVSSASSVLFPYGSPNTMGVGALCYVSYGMIAPHTTMGRMFINMFSDIENSELIVVWGTNPATDLPPIDIHRILEAQKRGAEVVVIDPRKTKTVHLTGGDWIPIRPGTDGALALGLCDVLIRNELYDSDFVMKWTEGFEEFSKYVQHFRPQVVEYHTGIPAQKVEDLAIRISEANGVSQLMYTGLEYANSGVQNLRATLILWALAGQLDVPGGLCFTMKENIFPINRDKNVPNPDRESCLGRDQFPVYVKYRDEAHAAALPQSVLEGKPYKIRSLMILGSSIITSWPDPEIWEKANPNYGVSVQPDDLARLAKKAEELPSAQSNFLRKRLNVWVGADDPWMNMLEWNKQVKDIDIDDFKGDPCFIGIDLASKIDIAAMMFLFVRNRNYYGFGKYYLPEERIQISPNSQYEGWVKSGHLTATPGTLIDYEYIEEDLQSIMKSHNVVDIAIDPFQATQFVTRMEKVGIEIIEVRPTVLNFSEPMKEMEGLVLDGRFFHNGDPVMGWMASNVVRHYDQKDNIYPRKENPENKIDGVIGLLMALNREIRHREERSKYEDEDMAYGGVDIKEEKEEVSSDDDETYNF